MYRIDYPVPGDFVYGEIVKVEDQMSEPITEAMLKAGGEIIKSWDIENLAVDVEPLAKRVFRAMEAARDAEKVVVVSNATKDLLLRLAMGEQPSMEVDRIYINEAREERLIRMFFRLTDKGAAYIAKETSNG